MRTIVLLIPLLYIFSGCEEPCPRDIKVGELYFSSSTLSLLPEADPPHTIEFENMKGNTMKFVSEINYWKRITRINVETGCSGDPSHQVRPQYLYFVAPFCFAAYLTDDKQYWLSYEYRLVNSGRLKKVEDTLFHEQLFVSGYKEGKPVDMSLLLFTSLRGNESRLPYSVQISENARFLSDTIIGNRTLYNVYTQRTTIEEYFRVFYSVKNGIEAFSLANGEIWLRKY